MNDRTLPRVVCAAIRKTFPDKSEVLIIGPRHFDMVMHCTIRCLCANPRDMADAEQGFIDQWGNFLTREQAWVIAQERGQFIGEPTHPSSLFSEDLY